MRVAIYVCSFVVTVGGIAHGASLESFVNYETAHVYPLALSPDGSTLAACNTPDNRVEIFDVSTGVPVPMYSIPVGIDPVTARFRTDTELWVVNQISDSVSVVDLTLGHVVATLYTDDAPADVVFCGHPGACVCEFFRGGHNLLV